MLSNKLSNHIEDICSVSTFFDPKKYKVYGLRGPELREYLREDILEEYLSFSYQRLAMVKSKFQERGFSVQEQEFPYKKFTARNAVFRKQKSKNQIWLTAHHDYCAGLGADDNASALVVMLEIADYFKDSQIAKKLVFASFDLEEPRQQGSKYFAKNLDKNDLGKIRYTIVLECLGGGKDITICNSVGRTKSDPGLAQKLLESAAELGHKFVVDDYIFYSDLIPLKRRGVKITEICSLNYSVYREIVGTEQLKPGTISIAHTPNDVPDNVNIANLVKVVETLVKFIEQEYK